MLHSIQSADIPIEGLFLKQFWYVLKQMICTGKACCYLLSQLFYYGNFKQLHYLIYEEENDSTIIVQIYVSVKKSLKTLEEERLLIRNNKIIGINILPCCTDEYIPYKEFINITIP